MPICGNRRPDPEPDPGSLNRAPCRNRAHGRRLGPEILRYQAYGNPLLNPFKSAREPRE